MRKNNNPNPFVVSDIKNRNDIDKISVVLLSYNTREITCSCLRSLFKHSPTIANIEVIVVDNASQDDSVEAIEREFPEVELIRNATNRGFSAACNQGIRISTGEIVLLLNSDTLLVDQSVDIALDYLLRHPEVGIVGGAMIGEDGKPQPTCLNFPNYSNILFSKNSILSFLKPFRKGFEKYRKIPVSITDVDAVAGGFLFVRRCLFRDIGLLDEQFFFYVEDIDLARRAREAGWRVVYLPGASVLHGGGKSTSLIPVKAYWWHHKSLCRYFQKHHSDRWVLNLLFRFGLSAHYGIWWVISHLKRITKGSKD